MPTRAGRRRRTGVPPRRSSRRSTRRIGWISLIGALVIAVLLALAARAAFGQTDVAPRDAAPSLGPGSETKAERLERSASEVIERRDAAITESLDTYLDDRGVRLAISVHDLASGARFDYSADESFATASTAKVNILAALLLQAEEEGRELSASERTLAREMITVSGNDPANTLHSRIGSGAGFAEAMAEFGLSDIEPGAGGVWGVTHTTTADQMRLLRALATDDSPLSADARSYATELMGEVVDEQVWGAAAAAREQDTVEIKNGWMPRDTDGGLWAVNSIGRVYGEDRDLLIAVYSDQHASQAAGIECVEHAVNEVVGALDAQQRPEQGDGGSQAAEEERDPDTEGQGSG